MITLLWIIAAILIATGLAGLVLPAIPGTPLLFLGLVAAAWAENFAYAGWITLTVLGILCMVAYLVDLAAGAFGARHFGASSRAMVGAGIGTILGLFFGFAGVIIGPFLGAIAGEMVTRRDLRAAGKAGIGTVIGMALGAAVKIALAFMMLGIFLTVRLFGEP